MVDIQVGVIDMANQFIVSILSVSGGIFFIDYIYLFLSPLAPRRVDEMPTFLKMIENTGK